MSQEAIAALRAVFERFARGDFGPYADLPDDFELVTAPQMPDAGTYRGGAARTWLNEWTSSFEELTLTAIDFIDADDKVVVEFIQRGCPRGSKTAVALRSWSVNTFRSGALSRIQLFVSRSDALEAAGLSE